MSIYLIKLLLNITEIKICQLFLQLNSYYKVKGHMTTTLLFGKEPTEKVYWIGYFAVKGEICDVYRIA